MGNRARTAIVAGLTALAVALASAPVEAQSFPRTYRRLIRQAVGEFETGNWAEARALFQRAHEIDPNARTLRGIGMCAFEMRDYQEAIDLLQRALESESRPLTRRLREETELLLVRARSFIGRFQVRTDPAEAQLLVDGAPPVLDENGQIVLPLGEHTFEASLAGYQPEERRFTVRGGEALEVTLTLSPLPEAVIVEAGVPEPALALMLAGAGTLLFDAYAIGWLVDRESELSVCRAPPEGFSCGNLSTLESQRDAALATLVISTVVAVGLAGAGLLWWLLEEEARASQATDPEEARVRCGPLGCVGRF